MTKDKVWLVLTALEDNPELFKYGVQRLELRMEQSEKIAQYINENYVENSPDDNSDTYEEGYKQGYNDGYDTGLENGYEEGKTFESDIW